MPKENNNLEDRLKNVEKGLKDAKAELGATEEEIREREGGSPSPVEQMQKFLSESNLEELVPSEFGSLSDAQKLKVVTDLQRRIVDVVREDAQTQYSKQLQEKMSTAILSGNKFKDQMAKLKAGLKNVGTNFWAEARKEGTIKKLESEIFEGLLSGPEGRKYIQEEIARLTQDTSRKNIDAESLAIKFIGEKEVEGWSNEEKQVAKEFEQVANEFQSMPYEWGQNKPKKAYLDAKEKYEDLKDKLRSIKAEKLGDPAKAGLEIGKIDFDVITEQTKNTHPEYQALLVEFFNDPNKVARIKANFTGKLKKGFGTKTAALSWGLLGLGYGARSSVRIAAKLSGATSAVAGGATLAGSALIGGVIGYWRGVYKGKKKAGETRKNMRYGKFKESLTTELTSEIVGLKEEKKSWEGGIQFAENTLKRMKKGEIADDPKDVKYFEEKIEKVTKEIKSLDKKLKVLEKAKKGKRLEAVGTALFADSERLTHRLNRLMEEVESAGNEEDKARALSLLSARIKHTINKRESGQVNFGDAKSFTKNNMQLAEALNKAVIVEQANSAEVNKDMEEHINSWIEEVAKIRKDDFDADKKAFIRRTAKRGAIAGAGIATVGYGIRWIGELAGWWGGEGTEQATEATKGVATGVVVESTRDTIVAPEAIARLQSFISVDTMDNLKMKIIEALSKMDADSLVQFEGMSADSIEQAVSDSLETASDSIAVAETLADSSEASADSSAQAFVDSTNQWVADAFGIDTSAETPGASPDTSASAVDSSLVAEKDTAGIAQDTFAVPDSTKVDTSSFVQQDTTISAEADSARNVPPEPLLKTESFVTTDENLVDRGLESVKESTLTLNEDAIINQGEGIENALKRQIMGSEDIARALGYEGDMDDKTALRKFAGIKAHTEAIDKGYVSPDTGMEIRVAEPGKIAYQFELNDDGTLGIKELQVENGQLVGGQAVETHVPAEEFEGADKANLEKYEYTHGGQTPITPDTTPTESLGESGTGEAEPGKSARGWFGGDWGGDAVESGPTEGVADADTGEAPPRPKPVSDFVDDRKTPTPASADSTSAGVAQAPESVGSPASSGDEAVPPRPGTVTDATETAKENITLGTHQTPELIIKDMVNNIFVNNEHEWGSIKNVLAAESLIESNTSDWEEPYRSLAEYVENIHEKVSDIPELQPAEIIDENTVDPMKKGVPQPEKVGPWVERVLKWAQNQGRIEEFTYDALVK